MTRFDFDAEDPRRFVDDDVRIPPPRNTDRFERPADEVKSQAELKREFYERLARRRSARG